uniref:DNA ligase ATP-dependent N-terminal domain-containing protein n=1 Tax=Romanomermis culicivorax TaxID=13658 RepID=A0A915KW22_ROMCU
MRQSVASTCLFAEICELLEALSSDKFKRAKRHELLAKFISCWRQKHKQLHGECQTDDSFFPAMRILLPNADRERGPYGFKELTPAGDRISRCRPAPTGEV